MRILLLLILSVLALFSLFTSPDAAFGLIFILLAGWWFVRVAGQSRMRRRTRR